MGEFIQLGSEHQEAIYDFLAESPIENVMMMGVILEEGLPGNGYREFVGYRVDGEWQAVACFSGDISLYAPVESAIAPMADYALSRVPLIPRIISRKETVDRFWQVFQRAPHPVLFDRAQSVFELFPGELRGVDDAEIQLATLDDLSQVAQLASAMSMEEIQMDPLRDHPAGFLRLVANRIMMQRYYLLKVGGDIRFQVHLNALTPYAGQVTGVYTPPAHRGHGYAKRGMAAFCAAALQRAPQLCLFVNDFNQAAIGLYTGLGFRHTLNYRAIFLDPAHQASAYPSA